MPVVSSNRKWYEARSVAELGLLVEQCDETVWSAPENPEILARALRMGAVSDKQCKDFVNSLSLLWEKAAGPEWLADLLKSIAGSAVCWKDCSTFVAAGQQVSPKLLTSWFDMTNQVKGSEFLVKAFMEMPVRHRSAVESVLANDEQASEKLRGVLIDNLRHNRGSCDCYLWLLESIRKMFNIPKKVKNPVAAVEKVLASNLPELDIVCDLTILGRILGRPSPAGSKDKSQKELKDMLNSDDFFRCLLVRNGEMEAVLGFKNFVSHARFLDASERQGLLVKILRSFPEARILVEDKTVVKVKSFGKMSSQASYQQKQKELFEIINVKIPANVKAIEVAREHGDLRENSEFKAAKEEQRILGSRRQGLERALNDVLPTDFSDVKIENTVVPGCKVTLSYEDGDKVSYCILGIWDNNPEKNILSYDTPLGMLLVGKNVAEEVEMPNGNKAVIERVEVLPPEVFEMVRGEE